ncbi:MAG: hypothetical protein HY657_15795 [Acidobacteria bacterium]|nr:hypothetical protein [Acidobacteriota bacterium]
MAAVEQNYENHRHRPTLWLVGALAAVLGFLAMVVSLIRQPGLLATGLLLLAFAVICVVLMVRGYALRLQDRIIRLEMQVRLARLGRETALARLSMPQIVALRFASDAELPALIDRALAENLSADQIKRAVTAWQPDDLRT